MTLPTWILQLGSIAGLGSLAFLVADRVLAGRPTLFIRRTGYRTRDLVISNASKHDILVRRISTYPKDVRVASSDSTKAIVHSQFGSFAAILPAEQNREFPVYFNRGELVDSDSRERAPFAVLVSWRRMRATWLPQMPIILFSSAKTIRIIDSAK